MTTTPLDPLGEYQPAPHLAALPKADLHLHQEWSPRLDRVLARRAGRQPYDWRAWASHLLRQTPPGIDRLRLLSKVFPAPPEADDDENFVTRIEDTLEEGAADGAVLVELRFGPAYILRPDFPALFHEAARRVRDRHPALRAQAVITLLLWEDEDQIDRVLAACCAASRELLGGIDLLYEPYGSEADWRLMYRVAERAAAAGLGITAHAGEFSPANIAAALRTPGLTRLGHAVYAASDPRLLEALVDSGVTIESCLSCNVVLGAVPSYETHPIRRFVECGIPVALCTDDPVQICTTIGREYTLAAALGFSPSELATFTHNAVRASFLPAETKATLLAELASSDVTTARR